jgi:excisionase family DNA binding protein
METIAVKPIDKIAVTVQEAAELLSVSVPTLYDMARSEGFPMFKVGRRTLISRSGLEEWVNAQTAKN